MATKYTGNQFGSPGFTIGDSSVDDELMASKGHDESQAPATLAAGQGVLLLGTPLAQRTADKKFVLHTPGASDGSQNFSGFLRQSTDTGSDANAATFQAQVVYKGTVVASKVVAALANKSVTVAATALASRLGRGSYIAPYDYYQL